jgi:hypothetical protein
MVHSPIKVPPVGGDAYRSGRGALPRKSVGKAFPLLCAPYLPMSDVRKRHRLVYVFLKFNLHEHSVLAALFIDSKNLCGDGSHFYVTCYLCLRRQLQTDFGNFGVRKASSGGGTDQDHRAIQCKSRTIFAMRRGRSIPPVVSTIAANNSINL